MNKSIVTLAGALLSASALVAAVPAAADQSQLHPGTQSLVVDLSGAAPEITVRNASNSKKLADVQLAILEPKVSIGVGGGVTCLGTTFENWKNRDGYSLRGGAFGIGRTSFVMLKSLPNSSDINNVTKLDAKIFSLSTNLLQHSQIGVNAPALVMAAAVQSGNKVQYLRQNHTINVKVPIRWESDCHKYLRNKVIKNTIIEGGQPTSFQTKDITLKIKYQADPDLGFVLNAQIANQGQGGFQAGEQNFIKITGGTFIEGIKNLKTKCPGQAAFKVRVTGQGNGHVKLSIADDGATVATSPSIELVNGKAEYAFSQNLLYQMPGQGDDHQYRIYYSAKPKNENVFPAAYQSIGVAFDWTHTCYKPIKVGVGLGGNGTIQMPGQQGQNGGMGKQGVKVGTPAPLTKKVVVPTTRKPARATTNPARRSN